MREIKYQAWDDTDKVMYKPLHLEQITLADWEMESVDGEYTLPHSDWAYCENRTIWRQFTNIKDKNGIEIYEGDIVFYTTDEENYKVGFLHSSFCLLDKNDRVQDLDYNCEYLPESDYMEVIGNVYEHGFLLDKELKKDIPGFEGTIDALNNISI